MKHFQKLRKKCQQQERHWQQRLYSQRSTITLITIKKKHSKNKKQRINQNSGIMKQDNIVYTIAFNELQSILIQIELIHSAFKILIEKDENIHYGLQMNQIHIYKERNMIDNDYPVYCNTI